MVVTLVLILVIRRIYPEMVLINVSDDLARSSGLDVNRYNLIYLFLIAVVVAMGVKIVGGLLTAALVAIPAATAESQRESRPVCLGGHDRRGGVLRRGILLFAATGLPAGPLIILIGVAIFLLSVCFKR